MVHFGQAGRLSVGCWSACIALQRTRSQARHAARSIRHNPQGSVHMHIHTVPQPAPPVENETRMTWTRLLPRHQRQHRLPL